MRNQSGSLLSVLVVLAAGGIAVGEPPGAARQVKKIDANVRKAGPADRTEPGMREITALIGGEERRLLIPTDPGPGLKVEMIPLSEVTGQTAAEPTAPIVYDSTPFTHGTRAMVIDTNGPLGPDSVGDDYNADTYNGSPFELEGFAFYGGVSVESGNTHGRVFFWFYDIDLRYVGKYFYADLPINVVTTWYFAGYPDWNLPQQGVVIMTTGDGSNGPNCFAQWNMATSNSVGSNYEFDLLVDGSWTDTSFTPDILSLKLEGNWFRPQLEAVGEDCCGMNTCSDGGCRQPVAMIDPFCLSGWDNLCGSLAQRVCPGLCEIKNRYISFKVPRTLTGSFRVIQVTPTFMYNTARGCVARPPGSPDLMAFEGQKRWTDWAEYYPEDTLGGTFVAAPLHAYSSADSADDWGSRADGGEVHLYGPEILPCSLYAVQISDDAWTSGCYNDLTLCEYSNTLYVATGNFGDIDPTDGLLVVDVARVVDKVKETPNRMSKVFTQLWPSLLDPWYDNVGALDIAMTVDAVKGNAYPYHGVP